MKEYYIVGQGEAVTETIESLTFSIAEGSVDPEPRIASGEIKKEIVDNLEADIKSGEFTEHDLDPESIPCNCMDCKPQESGETVDDGAKAAGGTTTGVIADALTTNRYRQQSESAPAHKKTMLQELAKRGKRVGGHTAASVPNERYAGCGAEDKLDDSANGGPSILGFLHRKHEPIFATMRDLGYEISGELESEISDNADKLINEGYATSGKALSDAGVEATGIESVKNLKGRVHNGVIVAILTEPGTRLNQAAIQSKYGEDYEVFEVHAWSIKNLARETSASPEEAHDKEIAGVAYNLAAGGVIAGPGMRIVVL